jgi:hypothetical protein
MANAVVTVEPLEGRKLFAITIDSTQHPGAADASADLTFPNAAVETAPLWSADNRPVSQIGGPKLSLSHGELAFEGPGGGGMGTIETLKVRNAGIAPLTIPAGGLFLLGRHAVLFQILMFPALPATIPPGGSVDVPMVFNPGTGEAVGLKSASLRILSTDPVAPFAEVALSGSAGDASQNPALGRILSF